MKTLILCDHFGTGGGAGVIAQTQAKKIAEANEVLVLTAHASKDVKISNLLVKKYDLEYNSKLRNYKGLKNRRALKILEKNLAEFNPEVCYIHNIHTNWSYAALRVLKKHGVEVVMTLHDVAAVTPYVKLCDVRYKKNESGYDFDYRYSWMRHLRDAKFTYNPFRNFVIKKYLNLVDTKIAVSHALADFYKENGIQVDRVEHNKLPTRAKESNIKVSNSIFFGGRLSTSKGAIQTVKYLAELKEAFGLEPTLLVVGREGVVTKKMLALAKNLNVDKQLQFLGWLEESEYIKAMQGSAVVIVPSVCFDSFPTVILEAMSLGKPVVATIFGGAREMIEDGQTGYLADPYNVSEYVTAVSEILLNSQLQKSMRNKSYQRFVSLFSYKNE